MATIVTTEDTTVTTYDSAANYGSTDYLETNNYATYVAAIYVQFPLTRKPVKTASLNMYCKLKESNASQLQTNATTESFDELDPTWDAQVAISSDLSNTFDVTDSAWCDTSIKSFANSTVRSEYVGVAIQSPTYAATANGSLFHSKEYNSASHAPYALVTYYAEDEIAHESQSLLTGEEWTWWGIIHVDSIDCTGDRGVTVDVTTPWGGTTTNYYMAEYAAYTWNNGTNEHYMVVPDIFCGGVDNFVVFDTYWWFGDSVFYVKTGGNDTANGITWTTAFATITKGAQTVPDGGKLYIEEGTYNSETQIQPTVDNAEYIIQPSGHTEAACTVTVNLA